LGGWVCLGRQTHFGSRARSASLDHRPAPLVCVVGLPNLSGSSGLARPMYVVGPTRPI